MALDCILGTEIQICRSIIHTESQICRSMGRGSAHDIHPWGDLVVLCVVPVVVVSIFVPFLSETTEIMERILKRWGCLRWKFCGKAKFILTSWSSIICVGNEVCQSIKLRASCVQSGENPFSGSTKSWFEIIRRGVFGVHLSVRSWFSARISGMCYSISTMVNWIAPCWWCRSVAKSRNVPRLRTLWRATD